MAPVRSLAQRYVLDFRCTGGDCPESCCTVGWRIAVDEGHYRKLKRALGEAAFSALVQQVEPARRTPSRFGLLVLDERGRCSQLDGAGLCSIHARFGADVLGDTCALYPRVPMQVGARRELHTALSCPEAARLALLTDGATDLVELPARLFPADRPSAIASLPRNPADPYVARFDDVRGTAFELLSDRAYPVRSRIGFTLALAARLGEFFHPGSTRYSDQLFDQTIDSVGDDERELLHRQIAGPGPREDARLAPHFVLEMLAARLVVPAQPSFLRLALAALEGCTVATDEGARRVEVAGGVDWPSSSLLLSVEALAAAHRRRVEALPPSLAERAEIYFENYAKSYWIREWYFYAPNLLAYAQSLALRLAVVRFLLLAHPKTAQAIAAAADDAGEAGRLLDEAIVEAVYGFARATEHQDDFFESVMRTMERVQLHALRPGLALLRF